MIQEIVTASSVTSDTVISFGGSMPRRETIKMVHNGQYKKLVSKNVEKDEL